jgi:enediyne biosynthesis protein E4
MTLVSVGGVGFAVSRTGSTPSSAEGPPQFVDETATAGIDQTYGGSSTYSVGGGVAVFDCNGDGKPELYLAGGGGGRAALFRNDSAIGGSLHFTRQRDPNTDLDDVIGAYPLDIDGDGNVDLVVLRVGENVVLRGLGDCRFERANEAFKFDGGDAMTTAFSATWEGSGLPTLAIGNYLQLDDKGESGLDCDTSEMVRPDATGATYGAPITLSPGYCALSMLFSDWDRSGRPDLRVSNDRHYYDWTHGQEQLWRIAPAEAPRLYVDGWVKLQIEGMGIASYDVTGDGYPDVYLTSQGSNKLQTLIAGPSLPTYGDIALERGVIASHPFTGGDSRTSTAWHPEFQDVNNDGLVDLFVSKGNVEEIPDYAMKDPSNLLLGQTDGTFKEEAEAAGVLDFARGRGAALADFNLDGMLDLVEVNLGAPVDLWRNVGFGDAAHPLPMGNWLGVTLRQPGSNRDAIGSRIDVRVGDTTMEREVTVGGGHAGGQLGPTHFGLGPAGEAQIRVEWPDGTQGSWTTVKANQTIIVERGGT